MIDFSKYKVVDIKLLRVAVNNVKGGAELSGAGIKDAILARITKMRPVLTDTCGT